MVPDPLLGKLASDLQEIWGLQITTPEDGALTRSPQRLKGQAPFPAPAQAGAALLSQQQDVHN